MDRKTYAVFIDSTEGPFQRELLSGVTEYAENNDINIVIFEGGLLNSPDVYESNRNVIFAFADRRRFDGILFFSYLVAGYSDSGELIRFCRSFEPIPLISVGLDLSPIPSIVVDTASEIRKLANHLIEEHGYGKFAFIRGDAISKDGVERFHEFLRILREHKIEVKNSNIVQERSGINYGVEAVRILVEENKADFDVLVAANDDAAMGAVDALKRRGIDVPGDVAVVGFDNITSSRFCVPPLTTVSQPIRELGQYAIDALHMAVSRNRFTPFGLTKIPSRLIIRQSCGCRRPWESAESAGRAKAPVTLPARIMAELEMADPMAGRKGFTRHDIEALAGRFIEAAGKRDFAALESAWRPFVLKVLAAGYGKRDLYRICMALCGDGRPGADCATGFLFGLLKAVDDVLSESDTHASVLHMRMAFGLRDIKTAMQLADSLSGAMDALSIWLPGLDIHTFYLSVYEEPHRSLEHSRLLLAYEGSKKKTIGEGGVKYPAAGLLPEQFPFPAGRRFTFIAESLFYGLNQIGFCVFNFVSWEQDFYDNLRRELSHCLMVTLYHERTAAFLTGLKREAGLGAADSEKPEAQPKARLSRLKDIIVNYYGMRNEMKPADLRVYKALVYINQNYNTDLSLEEVAGEVFMEASYFSRTFKQVSGFGFLEYLTQVRLKKALDLLKNPAYSVREVALSVGYKDSNYFAKVLKASTGSSPSEYRERIMIESVVSPSSRIER